jgi:chromosome segregation ATPase
MAEEPDTREQLEGLIRENRTLAETIEGLREELESLRDSLQTALQARQSAEEETEQAKQVNAELQNTVAELGASNEQLEAQVGRLSAQVEDTPLQPLTTKEASTLLNQTLQELTSVSGFEVRDAEVTLKVATAKLGEEPVFMIPEPESVDPATLHALTFTLRSSTS